MAQLQEENLRLKKLVAELVLDETMLQRGHLRPALYLEHSNRICPLQHPVDFIILRQLRQI
jgi:hypothetical protein